MKRFMKNTKGAVTVFVTLLLIPAMLVSGTAVDIARIHTARGILRDANQLAANSVLTQYNTLLHDLYGVFGIAKDDPILASLLDDYIRVSVFGEEARESPPGTLHLFYGSDLEMDGPLFVASKNLRDEDVLRRQIEEYMKFRGPVIIVKEILDALQGNKIKEDTEVIDDKLKIDSAIADLYDKYKELYEAIIEADMVIPAIGGLAGITVGPVSTVLGSIQTRFVHLKDVYSQWENEEDEEKKAEHEAHYQAILEVIEILTIGGQAGNTWSNGRWRRGNPVKGLNLVVEEAVEKAVDFKAKFREVVRIAREIDEKNEEISRKVDELERKLEAGECSEDLKNALMEQTGSPPMTMIERYRDILKWDDIESMGATFMTASYSYIDVELIPMLQGAKYRNKNAEQGSSLTREELATLSSNPQLALSESISAALSKAALFAGYVNRAYSYNMPPGFLTFAEHPGDNGPFFEALTQMMNSPPLDAVKIYDGQEDGEGSDAKEKQEGLINSLLRMVEETYEGLTNSPLGALSIGDSETPEPEKLGIMDIVTLIPKAIASPVMSMIHDPAGSIGRAGDYLLLLTYCTSMFSNYTTGRPDTVGKTRDDLSGISFPKSITGVPISPEVNYFFQSEWEYLFKGTQDAGKNLSAVTTLIFLVRLVCNYITVFNVPEITSIVSSIQGAFAWCPPLGLILGELARAAFVALESLIDVSSLRSGHKLPLVKKPANGEWVCSPSGVINAIANITSNASSEENSSDDEKGLSYSNYLMFFFLADAVFTPEGTDASAELAARTANLIEWNVINYKNDVYSDEEKMAEALGAEDRFRLRDYSTDFLISTTAHMRMLFLSMIFAQRFADSRGINMPITREVTVVDYRGY